MTRFPFFSSPCQSGRMASLLLLLCLSAGVLGQQQHLQYEILRKNEVVGILRLTVATTPGKAEYRLSSEVETRFLVKLESQVAEQSVFHQGTLTSSSAYRKFNGRVKLNKSTARVHDLYQIQNGTARRPLHIQDIRYNFHRIYTDEPVANQTVYSDNHERLLQIRKIAEHHYSIEFPDGSWNEYFYDNGVCVRVSIHHPLYKAQLRLISPQI